ncbi:hypothetical protein D3C85_1386780 [compost metagenome]
MQGKRDLGLHVGKLFLDQLGLRQGATELFAIQAVLPSGMPAIFGCPQRSPTDAVTGRVQTGKRTSQATHIREGVFLRAEHVVHDDFASDRRTQADLAMNRRSTQAFPAFFQNETANLTGIVFSPNHKHVGDRAVGDPHLGTGQAVPAVDFPRPGDH